MHQGIKYLRPFTCITPHPSPLTPPKHMWSYFPRL